MLRFNKSPSAVNSKAAWLHLKFNLSLAGEGGGGGEGDLETLEKLLSWVIELNSNGSRSKIKRKFGCVPIKLT